MWHPFTPMPLWLESEPLVITAADGMYLIDSDGRRYLDGVSSLWCNVHGHRVSEIDSAIREQLNKVAHTTMLGLASEPAILLGEKLARVAPAGLTRVFYSDAGATAVEIALKMAVQYWYNLGQKQRTQFVALGSAYHGDTVGAMALGRSMLFHTPYLPLLFPVHYAPSPHVYRSDTPDDPPAVRDACLDAMRRILAEHGPGIAAVIVEPVVQGAAGMIVQPAGFLAGVQRLAREFGVLLIADEVATGFGRTGRLFACEHEDVRPDIMCLGKGITGGYLPLAATLVTQRVFEAFLGEPWESRTFYHGHTYTGNPLACAAAIASLDLIMRNDLPAQVARKGLRLGEMLAGLRDMPYVGDVRHKGFMAGIELVADKASRRPFDYRQRVGARVCMNVRRHGVILRPLGDVIVIMPPLAMDEADLARIVDAVKAEVAAL